MQSLILVALLVASPPNERPNIVFLLADDMRADTIAALGNPHIRTPNLDRLAREGFAFTEAHITGGSQPAVCVPSRAMLLSGRQLFAVADGIPGDMPLWPEELRRAGYATMGVGKWHNGAASYARCFSAGGAIFFGGMHDHRKVPVQAFDPTGKYPASRTTTEATYSSELFTDEALRLLKERDPTRPFALYLAYTTPHDPRTPPPESARLYPPDSVPLPPNFSPRHPFDNGEMVVRDEWLLGWPREPAAIRAELAAYYAMITDLDQRIGRILDYLDAAGLADRTLVVFAADNGLALGSHGLLGKQNLYEHSVRVPLHVRGPSVPAGGRSDALCSLVDLFPTLCELTGGPAPAGLDGRSLVPLLRGAATKVHDYLPFAYRAVQRGIRVEGLKLIEYRVGGTRRTQLFDLARDPHERNDLASDPARAGDIERLSSLLAEWQHQAGDPLTAQR